MAGLRNLSIVVCSKNDIVGLNRTLDSLHSKELEDTTKLIILSDYSNHEIEELKKKYFHHSFQVYRVEPKGIYFAQNCGLKKVGTDFVQFLNGGDELIDISGLTELLEKMTLFDWGYGSLNVISLKGKKRLYVFNYQQMLHRLGLKYVPHPSSIIRTKAAIEIGGYDETYSSAADHKLFIQLSRRGKPITVNRCISNFYLGGLSTRSEKQIVKDCADISRETFGYFLGKKNLDEYIWKCIFNIRQLKKLIRNTQ
jgi:glycosyltransferase involved in cell wall biosynthesis